MKEKGEKDLAERVGEATLGFIRGIAYHGLGALIAVLKGGREAKVKIEEGRKTRPIYQIFERRGVEYRDFVVLKAQAAALLLLVVSVAFVFDLLSLKGFAPLVLPLVAYLIFLIQGEVKEGFGEDFDAYREFFYSYAFISLLLVLVKAVKPRVSAVTPYLHLVLISMAAVGAFSIAFKRRHGRDYTFGRVLKAGKIATVKVSYDIRANVKPGVHELKGRKGLKEGSRVKLKVEQGFLSLRGGRITGLSEEQSTPPACSP